MYQADRSERVKLWRRSLYRSFRNAAGFIIQALDGRARVYDFRYNDMALSLRRQIDNPAHTRKLEIRFQGERMLFAEWTDDGFTKRSYRSGVGKRGYVGTNEYPRWPGGSKQRHEA
ncbi:hypothetical protein IVB06_06970 [Bradyrhizobium sp. 171]|uniref:hypothetical protein n=1 Tax=Bradyrhizobium sp. 176 TaxID=2782646 RepID=UPI001FF7C63B|nr:hypothetical protein [Bradyrhizobium sp. 176]MCK1556087.1 hypothetical protein [Bradyrhizobium sp. 171]